MKSGLWVALTGTILLAAAGAAQSPGPAAPIGVMQVKEVGVAEIDTSHVKVMVNLMLVPEQTATLKDMQLCSLRLNGLPVFAAPLLQEVLLRKGVATALPPVYVTALFRDLSTVEPLRQMVEKQSVHIQGELVAGVQLGFVEKLALHTQHPKVEFSINQDVAVEVGSTPFQRSLALGILSAIDAGMGAKDAASKYIPGTEPAWIRDLEARAQPELFGVESSYSLTEGKTVFPVTSTELGFRVTGGKVVTPADVLEPWRYDAEFLGEVKSGAAKLVKRSQDLQLRPLNDAGAPLRLSGEDFTVDLRGTAEQEQVTAISSGHGQVQVLRRASPTSLAVLTLRAPSTSPGLAVAPAAVVGQDAWDQVAVFRHRVDPASGAQRVETLQLGARREANGIRLTQPVDSAVFGSPIVAADGVIGLVQDEQSGAFLPKDLLEPAAPPATAH
jgi:hypothetical protein